MTSPYLEQDLMDEEGFSTHAYPDPLSGGKPWTVGFGHTGPHVYKGLFVTESWARSQLSMDIATAKLALDRDEHWWRGIDDIRQDVLVDMMFNLGADRLREFKRTLGDIQAGRYLIASQDMLQSLWAKQVGRRARRLSAQMNTGRHVPLGSVV